MLEYGGSGDVQCILRACDPSKVLDAAGDPIPDGDFFTPEEMSSTGSVLEVAYTVDQAPDGTGTPATSITPAAARTAPTATDRMGGYQVGFAALYAGGPGTAQIRRTTSIQQKRSLYAADLGVLFVNAENAAEPLVVEITTEQDW